jgi:hypothetical protein
MEANLPFISFKVPPPKEETHPEKQNFPFFSKEYRIWLIACQMEPLGFFLHQCSVGWDVLDDPMESELIIRA